VTSVVGGNNAPATGTTLSPASETARTSGTSGSGGATGAAGDVVAKADLVNPAGVQIGTVEFSVNGTVVTVTADVDGLPAGFKGFHIHAIGKCEPNSANPTDASKVGDFLSAGGHLGVADAAHPGHQGDLSSLQVRQDGSAQLVTTTDAFDVDTLLDADGSAVIVHAGPDDFGNVPTRYAPNGPDTETQATGDSGGRAACGVVKAVSG
jgi:Cu-Zn family superoxide dismutase